MKFTYFQHLVLLALVPFVLCKNKEGKDDGRRKPNQGLQTSSASQTFLSDPTFQSSILSSTNTIRAQHNATALVWNATLVSYAQDWAARCRRRQSDSPFGENLASNQADVPSVVQTWNLPAAMLQSNTTKIKTTNIFNDLRIMKGMAKFTQLVWKNSTQIGCGRTLCGGQNGVQGWNVVCEFSPKGNVVGKFEQNVQIAVVSGTPNAGGSGQIGAAQSVKGQPAIGTIGKGKANGASGLVNSMQLWAVAGMVVMVFAALVM